MALSFTVDSYVLQGALRDMNKSRPTGVSFWKHYQQYPDPAMRAIVLEDAVATSGAVLALLGMGLSHATGNPVFDSIACTAVGGLLGWIAVYLIRWNKGFLLGKALDDATTGRITSALAAREAVEGISHIKSRWEGPETFAYQCAVDFDGRVLSDPLLPAFKVALVKLLAEDRPAAERDALLNELLRLYGEEVICRMEHEVAQLRNTVREVAPQAEWVEILPRIKHHPTPPDFSSVWKQQ